MTKGDDSKKQISVSLFCVPVRKRSILKTNYINKRTLFIFSYKAVTKGKLYRPIPVLFCCLMIPQLLISILRTGPINIDYISLCLQRCSSRKTCSIYPYQH